MPWLTVGRTPSRGQSSRIYGYKSGRVHHVLSELEAMWLILFDWCDDVVDIREQYPLLPLEQTMEIATVLGVVHPTFQGRPVVMTSDFVVTMPGEYGNVDHAVACKPSSALDDHRVLQKLEIERRYWRMHRTPWTLATERDLRLPLIQNLKWVRPCTRVDYLTLSGAEIARITDLLARRIHLESSTRLTSLASSADDELSLPVGTCLTLIRHALATKKWPVDMSVIIDPNSPLTLVDRSSSQGRSPR